MDLVIGGRAYLKGKLQPVDIGIENGKIVEVRRSIRGGDSRLDYGDSIILPAAIDVHTHMRDPGLTKKEDFATGTIAAACGGVTCVFDMPNTNPPTIRRDDLLDKKSTARQKAWVDYGLFGGCTSDSNLYRIALEVVGFKIFMGSTTGDMLLIEDRDIARVLETAKKLGKVTSVHAEDQRLLAKKDEVTLRDHEEARPVSAELSAISRLSKLAKGAKVNVCHVTCRPVLDVAKAAGFTVEAAPHHMLLDLSMKGGAYLKVNPPLRTRKDAEGLLSAFAEGKVDMLATDHAPHTVEEKEEDFDIAPSGVPGVETSIPMMMALVKQDVVPLRVLIEASAERPASVFGLNKGKIEVGRDADLNIFDTRQIGSISARRLHSKCGWTPYEGREAVFPRATFLRGMMLTEDGSIVGERAGRDVVVPKPRVAA
ncbi:MAG: dihydroorotase [Methanomassiliicoccales archaeon]|nr:dihydroorotase [Methanomassiliicoccales archaeon]